MPTKCNICGEYAENYEDLELELRFNWSGCETLEEFRDLMDMIGGYVPEQVETNCRCHECAHSYCSTQIRASHAKLYSNG